MRFAALSSHHCWPVVGAILAKPHSLTVGASGAVFGLMAAAFMFQRARGIDPGGRAWGR